MTTKYIVTCVILVFSSSALGKFLVQLGGNPVVPSTPCPEVFQYYTQPNGYVFGRITIPYDGSTNLHLGVNASMKGYYTNDSGIKLKITMNNAGQDLMERRTNMLSYDIHFPFQHAIPKITRIEYNHGTYCTGPPEELVPGAPGVTSLWSGHNYYFQLVNRRPEVPYVPPQSQPDLFEPIVDVPEQERYPMNEISTTTISYPTVTTTEFLPEISSKIYPEFTSRVSTNKKTECGVSKNVFVPLILGGKGLTDGMYPWLVAMFTTTGNGYEYKCTANLVSNRHVVTAARCTNFFKIQVVQTDDILFVFGRTNLKHWATSGAVTRGASFVRTNPDFNANSGHGDISVITLDRPVEFSSTIAPICLWEGDDNINNMVDKKGTVAGWGADEASQKTGKYSISVAKSVDMPIVAQDSCLFSNLSYFQLTSDVTFCAGKRDGTGTCIGDSGAGFMINKNGKFYLRGLASLVLSDKGKCDLTNFMVFCDAAKLTDWIRDALTI